MSVFRVQMHVQMPHPRWRRARHARRAIHVPGRKRADPVEAALHDERVRRALDEDRERGLRDYPWHG